MKLFPRNVIFISQHSLAHHAQVIHWYDSDLCHLWLKAMACRAWHQAFGLHAQMPIEHMVLKIYVPCKNFHVPSQYLYKPCKAYVYCWENKYVPRPKNYLPSRACNHKSLCALEQDLHAWTAPSHYLNQRWNIVNWTLGNKLQWNFNRNSNIFIEENTFENVVCEMASLLSRPQCVNVEPWLRAIQAPSHCLNQWIVMLSQEYVHISLLSS